MLPIIMQKRIYLIYLDGNIMLKEFSFNPKFIKKSNNSVRIKPTNKKLVECSSTIMVNNAD